MGQPSAQERGLEEGLSLSEQCRPEKLQRQLWKLDFQTTRGAAWNSVSFSGTPGNTGAHRGQAVFEPDTGSRAATAEGGRPRGAVAPAARRRELGAAGDRSPRVRRASVQQKPPRGALPTVTVTQRARGRQGGRGAAARTAP